MISACKSMHSSGGNTGGRHTGGHDDEYYSTDEEMRRGPDPVPEVKSGSGLTIKLRPSALILRVHGKPLKNLIQQRDLALSAF